MAYFPEDMPRPDPDWDDRGFWDNCREQKLRFQACGNCGLLRHPPRPMCGNCQFTEVRWVEAPEEARVYSYNVVHYVSHPAVANSVPYVGAVLEFEGMPGVRLVTNITDIDTKAVRIGMTVRLWWDDIGDGMHVPRFRPIGDTA